ncbi:MAG: hypothetical protein LBT53_05490, partial [Puniceicoccales bacterium]|nr:hypothetical protein [Puniceicoccales bacterium]
MSAVHGGTISPPQTQKRDRHFFPLKPHELLRDTTERIFDCLASLLQKLKTANKPLTFAWLVHESGDVEIYPLAKLLSDTAENADDEDADEGEKDESPSNEKTAEKVRKLRVLAALADATLILPASLGGIDETGLLSPTASASAATPPALPPLPPPSAPSVSEHREQVPLPTPASLTPSEKSALLARLDLRIAALLRKALLQSGIPEKLVASAE